MNAKVYSLEMNPTSSHEAVDVQNEESSSENEEVDTNSVVDPHPYLQLLMDFKPTPDQLVLIEALRPVKSLEETPLCEIYSKQDLEKLISDLKGEKEIAVDVEYSSHGYIGVTCLVQISTISQDYIIDAMLLQKDMYLLGEIFCDPTIVKIFHGSSNDLKWLQEDCRLFVVNMFDTCKAMKALGYERLGLDVTLQQYNVVKKKGMKLADFRIRPLPPKYKDYARTDSHFLIDIYNKLKYELIQAGLLLNVLLECNDDCKIVHEKTRDNSYSSVVRFLKSRQKRQLMVLRELNEWRHQIAERLNVNVGFVLSKNSMRALACELPTKQDKVLKICNSIHVKTHLEEILKILLFNQK